MDYHPESPVATSLPVYLRFKQIPINLRQDVAPQNVKDESDLFLRAATSYESLGMKTLALYALNKWDVTLEEKTASSELDWEWGTSASSYNPPPLQEDPAIHSGQINFDDWSWGGTTTTRATGQSLFDATPKQKDASSSRAHSALSSLKLQIIHSYKKRLALRMSQEGIDSLRVSKVPGLLPKALVYSYLDTVKTGIQHLCRLFEVDEAAFDDSLVHWCCDESIPLLGFELVFQGILSQELTGQWLIDDLLSECGLLVSICFDKDINLYYQSNTFKDWIRVAIRDYPRWSVALRLTGRSDVTTPQLQTTMTILLTAYLLVLLKERDYSSLLPLLKNWAALTGSIKNDLHQFEALIEQTLKNRREV